MLLAMEEYCKDIKYKHLEQIIQEFSPTLGSSKFEFVLEKITPGTSRKHFAGNQVVDQAIQGRSWLAKTVLLDVQCFL